MTFKTIKPVQELEILDNMHPKQICFGHREQNSMDGQDGNLGLSMLDITVNQDLDLSSMELTGLKKEFCETVDILNQKKL